MRKIKSITLIAVVLALSLMLIVPSASAKQVWQNSPATEYDGLGANIINNCVLFARYKVPSLPYGLVSYDSKKNYTLPVHDLFPIYDLMAPHLCFSLFYNIIDILIQKMFIECPLVLGIRDTQQNSICSFNNTFCDLRKYQGEFLQMLVETSIKGY